MSNEENTTQQADPYMQAILQEFAKQNPDVDQDTEAAQRTIELVAEAMQEAPDDPATRLITLAQQLPVAAQQAREELRDGMRQRQAERASVEFDTQVETIRQMNRHPQTNPEELRLKAARLVEQRKQQNALRDSHAASAVDEAVEENKRFRRQQREAAQSHLPEHMRD